MNISLSHLCLEVAQWLLIVALFLMLLRRKSQSRPLEKPSAADSDNYRESVNSISLLGGFCVRNRDGEDVSSRFSPILRKVIFALVVHSAEDKQGVPGERLDAYIWGYKPEGTASNNRNVYLSRLRKALDTVDGVSVITRNQLTSISLSPEASCDYLELMRLYKKDPTSVDVEKLISLLSKGDPFSNMSDAWMRDFHDEFSTATVAFLTQLLSRENLLQSTTLKISDIIQRYDKLNESALRTRCRLYRKQGNLSFAKEIYEQYCRDHKEFIGEHYCISFKEIIS